MAHYPLYTQKSIPSGCVRQADRQGLDLSKYNKVLNEVEFSDVVNLHFVCSDVFRFFEENKVQNGVFFHARTLLFLPDDFNLKLYKECKKSGYKYIVGFEQFGLSSETEEEYEFSKEKKPSVYWRDRMYIHNNPGIATEAGFEVIDFGIFETGHANPDYRRSYFVAKSTSE